MIHYQLRCKDEHAFDGWFKDSASFDKQAKSGMLECPVCGTAKVQRALMAPSVGRKSNKAVTAPPAPPKQVAVKPDALPDHMRAMLQKLRAEVEKNCDYVGDGFAKEARRIHDGDAPERAIYGEATQDQVEALADDGIDIAAIPWVPRADG